ncbi:MAG: phosphodiester glycosidase family protein [Abditibacteriota bacterium]|nr:phosphodiester glycosidase family protein [Abditibacteriota bacterium]
MKNKFALAFIALTVLVSASFAEPVYKDVAEGVTLYQEFVEGHLITAAIVDLNVPGVSIRSELAGGTVGGGDKNGRETITGMVKRTGAVVGLNGDYFPWTGDPCGFMLRDGELISEPVADLSACGFTADNKFFVDILKCDGKLTFPSGISRTIDAVNRPRETNQLVVYTPTMGKSTKNKYRGTEVICDCENLPLQLGKEMRLKVREVYENAADSKIPEGCMAISAGGPAGWFLKENARPGQILRVKINVRSAYPGRTETATDWTTGTNAMAAGPNLVENGEVVRDVRTFRMQGGHLTATHPRSAIGVTADNKVILLALDGRQSYTTGVSTAKLGEIMKRLGCVNAMNLDGGGSTTLSVRGIIVNSPSDAYQRSVCNGWVVFAPQSNIAMPNLRVFREGDMMKVTAEDGSELTPEQLRHVIWGTRNGGGFVDQTGRIYSRTKTKAKPELVFNGKAEEVGEEIGGEENEKTDAE